jgi:hypothetical protein
VVQKVEAETTIQGRMARLSQFEKTGRFPLLKELLAEDKPASAPQSITTRDLSGVPPLPEATRAQQNLAYLASPTLDEMIRFFRYWATRSYEGYHEAVAIWVLSTIAARRVFLPWRQGVWTPLYIMLVADSTTHAKTEAASYGKTVIEACGLRYLLTIDDVTAQKLLSNMQGKHLPRNYALMDAQEQEYTRLKLAFSAQRGWTYEEFGNKLQEIIHGNGPNKMFHGLLKRLYDCKREHEYDTLRGGHEHIDMPYLSIIGTATPACLRPVFGDNSALWSDGTAARIAFIVPPRDDLKLESAPLDYCQVPSSITEPLKAWHERLGLPYCEILDTETLSELKGKKRKDGEPYEIYKGELPQSACVMAHEVYKAYELYYQSLVLLARDYQLDERFKSVYGRLPDMALRMALLLASLENNGHVDMRHWGKGQEMTEHWRANFHELVAQLSLTTDLERNYEQAELQVLDALKKLGGAATARIISQQTSALRKLGTPGVRKIANELLKADGILYIEENNGGG